MEGGQNKSILQRKSIMALVLISKSSWISLSFQHLRLLLLCMVPIFPPEIFVYFFCIYHLFTCLLATMCSHISSFGHYSFTKGPSQTAPLSGDYLELRECLKAATVKDGKNRPSSHLSTKFGGIWFSGFCVKIKPSWQKLYIYIYSVKVKPRHCSKN